MSNGLQKDGALVLFSGGQDSTTCLAWALERFDRVETIGFDYGQRHRIQINFRKPVADGLRGMRSDWAVRLGEDHTVSLDAVGSISDTALTREVTAEMKEGGLRTRLCRAVTSST